MNLELFQFNEESYKKFNLQQIKEKRELINLINESVYNRCAKTSKEKYEILDLRDKILKLIRFDVDNQIQSVVVDNAQLIALIGKNLPSELSLNSLHGNCVDMCPERERYSREYLNLIHKYEMKYDYETESNMLDHNLMIKEYSRSSADQDLPLPNEMRPLSVLYDTMMFIVNEIITKIETHSDENNDDNDQQENGHSSSFSVGEWYDFIWNRTRSIRKDIIQQRLLINRSPLLTQHNDDDQIERIGGVLIIEKCARFHIMCSYRLCEESSQVFDFKINEENLKNCFQSLRQFYEHSSSSADVARGLSQSPNEAEFRSYIILLNLNESNILSEIQRWPKHIRHSRQVRFALKIYFAYASRNYVSFFRMINFEECEYLQACILHRYFAKIRCQAFESIFTAYKEIKGKVYPLEKLAELLGFDEEKDAEDYCLCFDMKIEDHHNGMRRVASLKSNDMTQFNCSDLFKKLIDYGLHNRKSNCLIESKFFAKLNTLCMNKEDCLSCIISGLDEVRPSPYSGPNNVLSSSFDIQGYYVGEEIEDYLQKAHEVLKNLRKIEPNKENTLISSTASTSQKLEATTFKSLLNKNVTTGEAAVAASKPNSILMRKKATDLVKKALNTSIVKPSALSGNNMNNNSDQTTGDQPDLRYKIGKERRKSGSSVSSESSQKAAKQKKIGAIGASNNNASKTQAAASLFGQGNI
jgi:hypothetical protein